MSGKIMSHLLGESELERQARKLCSTPEGEQALEDALVRWQEASGEPPDEDQLAAIVRLLSYDRSPVQRTIRNNGPACVLACIVMIVIGSFMKVFVK